MKAVAKTMQEPQREPQVEQPGRTVRARAEHISIETSNDDATAAAKQRPRRKVRLDYALHSKLRGCVTELAILEDHFLSVHTVRPDCEPRKYEFDLRFANAKPRIVRYVAWFWLALAVSLTLLSVGALMVLWPPSAADWANPAPLTAVAACLAAAASVFMFLRRTTESLEFTSVHGGVTLVSVVGAIGSARDGKKFFVELIKSIAAAKAARPQNPPLFLRDEMREHHRLRELGALTEAQYEASKARILSSH